MRIELGRYSVNAYLAVFARSAKSRIGRLLRETNMTQDAVIDVLRTLLSERLRVSHERVESLEPDSNLLEGGLGLDSLDCIELLLGLEDEFNIEFSEEEEEWAEHFSTLNKLSQLVLHMKNERL